MLSAPRHGEMAEHAKVPLITPAATFPNVRRLGSFVFSTTLTHALQAKRIAGYATGEQGYRRFCILYPDTTYGREQARLFAQEVLQHEGEVIAMESFKEGDSAFSPQIKRLKAEDLKKYGLAVPYDPSRPAGKPVGKADKRILYTPGFDAIFIPSRASEIGLLAAQLAFHDVKSRSWANGWNSPDPHGRPHGGRRRVCRRVLRGERQCRRPDFVIAFSGFRAAPPCSLCRV
jgi:ABC-type branched-subunit amino acid transport system substrate-binding protein